MRLGLRTCGVLSYLSLDGLSASRADAILASKQVLPEQNLLLELPKGALRDGLQLEGDGLGWEPVHAASASPCTEQLSFAEPSFAASASFLATSSSAASREEQWWKDATSEARRGA